MERKDEMTDVKHPRSKTTSTKRDGLSRRRFLKGTGLLAVGITAIGSACRVTAPKNDQNTANTINVQGSATPLPTKHQYQDVAPMPATVPNPNVLQVFKPHEALTVEALTARIMPGTPDDPGAREAGVVTYIDTFLAYNEGFDEKTYRSGPYAKVYQGKNPPSEANSGNGNAVWVSSDDIERYGYQSELSPRDVYRMGIEAVDKYSQKKFSKNVVDLSEDQQDSIIDDLVNGKVDTFDDPRLNGEAFFHNLRRHTSEGMFSDPGYGGNRNLIGWKLVGYPGAQRSYTPEQFRTENYVRQPQSLAQMMPFKPGQGVNPDVILPVSGSHEP
jgi:gluconate 2-dehydrogenase gamma chain